MPPSPTSGRSFAIWLTWAITAAAFAAKAVAMAPGTPLILDSDDAMRLVEVRDFAQGQPWFDLIQHRLDTPFGSSMHWSRLIDWPEALLYRLFIPVAGGDALTWLAWVWPLLLLWPLLWLSVRLAEQLGGRSTRWPTLVLVPLSLATIGEFAPGRVDHHSAQILATLAMVWLLLQALERPGRAAAAGLAGAVALTIGVEGLPAVAAAILALGLAFIGDARHAAAFRNLLLGLATAASLGLATTVSPADWLLPRLDQISIVYVAAAWLGAVAALLVSLRPAHRLPIRFIATALVGGGTLAALVALFPALLAGPYAALDPWLVTHWMANVAESQTLLASLAADPVYPLAMVVPVLVGLATLVVLAMREPQQRMPFVMLAIILAVGLAVMVVQVRAGRIVTPLAVPAGALLVSRVLAWSRARRGLMPAAAVTASLAASAGVAVAVVVALLPFGPAGGDTGASRLACLQPSAFAALASGPPKRLLAPIDLGAHLLLLTPHSVVGAPYHRNQDGLRDTFRVFNDPAPVAQEIAMRRGIDWLVLCPQMKEVAGLPDRAPDSLAASLAAGRTPDWLVELPRSGPLRVFAVRR